jgi:pimeloyl-ACP methyl ester carboxylesterase
MLKRVLMKPLVSGLVAAVALSAGLAAHAAEPTAFTVQVSGQGKPMILIAGLASSGAVWDATVAHFAPNYRCYVLQLAGFAGAPAIPAPLLETVEKELATYIDEQHLDHPTIVGHSLGGFLALKMAVDFPTKLGPLVIVDSLPALGAAQMPDVTPDQLKDMARRIREGMLSGDAAAQDAGRRATVAGMVTAPQDVDRVVEWGAKSDRKVVADAMHDIIATDLRQDIARIKTPTLVLGSWVAYKAFAPKAAFEANYKAQYAKLPGVQVAMSDIGRHFIMYDDPQWMLARMDEFLK